MIWSLDLDDFSGNFCGQGKYPLLTKVKKTFGKLSIKSHKTISNGIDRNFDRFLMLFICFFNIIFIFL
jgi:hypothetical protein